MSAASGSRGDAEKRAADGQQGDGEESDDDDLIGKILLDLTSSVSKFCDIILLRLMSLRLKQTLRHRSLLVTVEVESRGVTFALAAGTQAVRI